MAILSGTSSAGQEEDDVLLRQCLNGDEDAFERLYSRYRLPLYSYLHRLLSSQPEQVDDFFQQTWIKASRSLGRYRHQEKFLAWLCRIGHNLVMDYYRSHDSDAFCELPETLSTSLPTPEAILVGKEVENALEKAIRQLPPEQQSVLRLRNQGVPFKEIAEREKIGLNTALGRMHYAVLNLKRILSEYL